MKKEYFLMNYGYGMIKSIKICKDFKHITMSFESVVVSMNLKKLITKDYIKQSIEIKLFF